jgi:hypothetical protein
VIVLEFYSVWRTLLIAIHNGCFTSIPDLPADLDLARFPPEAAAPTKAIAL